MIIKYIGHACFKVKDDETGYSIIFDPYQPDSVRGFSNITDTASEVLCSHDHFDHNSKGSVRIEPMDESPFEISIIDTFHDDVKGAKRGTNRVTVVRDRKTGERLVHYGDIGEVLKDLLTEENRALLEGADVALIPVGGTYTYDADQALDLIEATKPSVTVPMHFRSEAGDFGLSNIGSIEEFLAKAKKRGLTVKAADDCFFDTDENDPGRYILTVMPQNA